MYYSTLPDHIKPRLPRRQPTLIECFAGVIPWGELTLAGVLLMGWWIVG
jgi:hypothetical protein